MSARATRSPSGSKSSMTITGTRTGGAARRMGSKTSPSAARAAWRASSTACFAPPASSRWKDLAQVDEAGRWACDTVNASLDGGVHVTWWGQNWRKGGLQDRRNQLIRELNFYNQQYCGCEYSFRDKK